MPSTIFKPTQRGGGQPHSASATSHPLSRRAAGYLDLTARPLHVLAFLLPLIAAYEIGSLLYLGGAVGGIVDNIRAHSMMLALFQEFGVVGRFIPATLLITVLLAWHLFNRDRWRLRPSYLAGMALESLMWTVPLLVIVALVQLTMGAPAPPAIGGPSASLGQLAALPPEARITISIGAGLYEELLFRMIGLALLHAILVDLLRVEDTFGTLLAITITAVAFALYHDVTLPSGAIHWPKAIALVVAGAYFGLVYVLRGFGIVVAVHALYDVFVLVIIPR